MLWSVYVSKHRQGTGTNHKTTAEIQREHLFLLPCQLGSPWSITLAETEVGTQAPRTLVLAGGSLNLLFVPVFERLMQAEFTTVL